MKTSLKKNFIYNGLMLFFNIGFPLITAPYISRVLGAEKIGEISFATSFAQWFILLSAMGFTVYGTREIARIRDNKEELNKVFSEILTLNIITVIFFLIVYYIIIFSITKFQNNNKILLIYSINLVLSFSSLEWFYYGIENYEYISKRSLLFKSISVILLFIFVREEKDFYNYVSIIIFAMGASNILNLINSKKYVKYKFGINLKHIFNAKIFYFQNLLGSVYNVIDVLLLGILSTSVEVGYYTRSKQLIGLLSVFILCFARTIYPRLSNYYITEISEYKRLVNFSFKIISFLNFPFIVGTIFLSEDIMYLFGGENFIGASNSLKIMSLLLFSTIYSVFLDTHISVPSGNEKNTFYGNIGVAICTLSLNLILLKKYGSSGAAIGICCGELIGFFIQFYRIHRQKLYLGFLNKKILKYILSSLTMGISLFILKKIFVKTSICNTLYIVFISGMIYLVAIYIYSKITKDEDNEIEFILKKIRRRV